jgi:hypothetical protein
MAEVNAALGKTLQLGCRHLTFVGLDAAPGVVGMH